MGTERVLVAGRRRRRRRPRRPDVTAMALTARAGCRVLAQALRPSIVAPGDASAPVATWRAPALCRSSAGAGSTRSPARFTAAYLIVLLGTTLVLRHVSAAHAQQLLVASSTDVRHLMHTPVRVLFTSALWLPDKHWLPYAAVFGLFMAPLERRVGVRWLTLIFLSGHVLATLLTELPIAAGIATGWFPDAAADRLDVGVSYGMYAVIGACAGLFAPRMRLLITLGTVGGLVIALAAATDMTSVGHLLSVLIGVCWQPTVRRRCRARDLAASAKVIGSPTPSRPAVTGAAPA